MKEDNGKSVCTLNEFKWSKSNIESQFEEQKVVETVLLRENHRVVGEAENLKIKRDMLKESVEELMAKRQEA